jgi:hypothetical protein
MSHDEIIAVIQAHRDGKPIQYRRALTNDEWQQLPGGHSSWNWNFEGYCYRVKPEPRRKRKST